VLKKLFAFLTILLIFISLFNLSKTVSADWLSYWGYRKQITINSSFIDNTLRNFPILVYISNDTSLSENALANGDDICFWNENLSLQYNHEIVRYNSSTGELLAWVNITTLHNDSDTIFWLYYGNSASDNQENKQGTWNSDYILVLHMNSSGLAWDSTSYENHFRAKGNLTFQQEGKVGYAIQGDNATGYLVNTTMNLKTIEAFTFECWYNIGDYDPTQNQWFLFSSKYDPANDIRLSYYDNGFNNRGFQSYYDDGIVDGCQVTTYSWDNNSWHYYVSIMANSTGEVRQYHNATLDCIDDDASYNFSRLDNLHRIGCRAVSTEKFYKGILDEIRISKVVRNQTWLNVSFHTSNQTNGFMTIGATEQAPITFSNPYPEPGATDVVLIPTLRITVNESNGNPMNLTWLSNSSGEWLPFGTNNSVYNGTYTMVNQNFSEFGTTYYWRVLAESTISFYSPIYYFTTTPTYVPEPPYNIETDVDLPTNSLNISWIKGKRADYTLVVKKEGAYPSNYTDGTLLYNGTGNYYNDTNFISGWKYRLWSYNATGNYYSSPANADYGALDINCYNESDSSAITFDVFISDREGKETYVETNCTNTHTIDISLCPTGYNTIIKISAEGYNDRIYYMDIFKDTYYVLNAYLPPKTKTKQYLFQVIDESNLPVPSIKLSVGKYINETVGYENITILLTDGYGQVSTNLIPNFLYKIYIEQTKDVKPKYKRQIDDFLASKTDLDHIFKVYFIEDKYKNITRWQKDITFEGYIKNNKLYINYSDSLKRTSFVKFTVYEYNVSTNFLNPIFTYYSIQNECNFSVDINVSNMYIVKMEQNHSYYGYIIYALEFKAREKITTKTRFNLLFEANYGTNPFGWSNFIGFMIVIACLFSFGERGSGLSLMGTGFLLLFINNIIGFTVIAVVVPIVFVILGILVEWNNRQKEV